jgi:amino acid adenylation domain-containing protein
VTSVSALREVIVNDMAWSGDPDDLTEDYLLIENEVIDSLGIQVLVTYLEEHYSIIVDIDELVPDNFETLGAIPGDRVGLYLEKSAAAVVGIYGALKAGAAYVPIDPQSPIERAAYIARNCGVRCVLTSRAKSGSWATLAARAPEVVQMVALDASGPEFDAGAPVRVAGRDAIAAQPAGPPEVRVLDQDVAYILYTSGSTGHPKGVTLTHRNAIAFVAWAAEEFSIGPTDRVSSHAPFHFDLSIFDLFAAAWGGASVVLVPPRASVFPIEVARFIREQNITVWYSVPSILSAMTTRGNLAQGDFPELRTVLFAGEVFPPKYLRTLMSQLPHVRFANLYGPTETNVCTWYEVPPQPEQIVEAVPIGQPIVDDAVYVVTDDGRLAAPGEVGELYVRGATVMKGYWADPDRTGRTLIPDPFADALPDPVYRTGDLVRADHEGNLHLLGRRDAQIKSRGYRIELGEIETALYAHPSVLECAVLPIPDDEITNRIKAFVVSSAPERELVKFCRERVPAYMIPHTFEFRDALPRTSTGKVDRQALASERAAQPEQHLERVQ